MKTILHLAFATMILLPCVVSAQGLTAIKPIDGYACMRLRLTHAQAIDHSFTVPVFSGPSATSPELGTASAIVLVRSPSQISNGFQGVLFPNGQAGWIEDKWLMPFPTQDFPRATCTPSTMSNGRPGFKINTNQ